MRNTLSWTLLAALALASLGLSGCLAPTQYGGDFPVDQQGFAKRFNTVCRVKTAAQAAKDACGSTQAR